MNTRHAAHAVGARLGAVRRATSSPAVAWPSAVLVVVLVSVAAVVLRRRIVSPLGWSAYDGLLHIHQAASLMDGDWLSRTYDNLTLVKAPGYSLFLAACHELGLAAKDGEQIVVLVAAAVVATIVLVTTRRLLWATVAYAVCALDPIYLSTWSADYTRDALFSSITLLVVSLLFLTGHLLVSGRVLGWALLPALLGGFFLASYLLTREEGITVLPVAGVALLAAPVRHLLATRRTSDRPAGRRALRGTLKAVPALLLVVIATVAPVAVVLGENDEHYGVATTSELAGGAFQGAYAQWQRVEAGEPALRVPITEAQRLAVYPVSEAARALEPSLEDPQNQWRFSGCTTPPDCDYAGGWITWALRDAAAAAGYFGSAGQAADFFGRLGSEIAAACDSGQLTCRAQVPATAAPLLRISTWEFVQAFTRLWGSVLSSKDQYWQQNLVPWGGVGNRAEFVQSDLGLPITPAGALLQTEDYTDHEWQYQTVSIVYSVGFPAGVVAGVLVLVVVLGTAAGRRAAGPLTALPVALLFGAVLRIALISVIHAADYDADQPRYLYPAQILLVAFAVVAVVEGFRVLRLGEGGLVVHGQQSEPPADEPSPAEQHHGTPGADPVRREEPDPDAHASAVGYRSHGDDDLTVPIPLVVGRGR